MGSGQGTPQQRTHGTEADRRDRQALVPQQGTAEQEAVLGLALSGGGVRAALFSLGAVIGLIETGLHRRVGCVASVSGGSILNAALAHAPSLRGFSTVEEFEKELASKLAFSLARRGAFFLSLRSAGSGLSYLFSVLVGSAVPILIGLGTLASALKIDLTTVNFGAGTWWWVGGVVLASVAVSIFFSRGQFQQAVFTSVLRHVSSSSFTGLAPKVLRVKEWGVGEPGVMHVLVATDLLSGEPMYFSGQFVHCRPYGWSTPREVTTGEAVYSSAAFPAVFPPKRLRLSRLVFQKGEMPGKLPHSARLADGGIYNNLGTDWFEVLAEQLDESRPPVWPFGELEVKDPPRIDRKDVIVVNASAPSRSMKRLGLRTLARIMSVLYDNTVRPRVESIKKEECPLIDIAESPLKVATRLAGLEGAAGDRARKLVAKLEGESEDFWVAFQRETAGTATKLSRAGHKTGGRLILHGYLSSLVVLHVRMGAELPEVLRGEEHFRHLVDDALSGENDSQHGSAAADPSDGVDG